MFVYNKSNLQYKNDNKLSNRFTFSVEVKRKHFKRVN